MVTVTHNVSTLTPALPWTTCTMSKPSPPLAKLHEQRATQSPLLLIPLRPPQIQLAAGPQGSSEGAGG